jgi:hypothetical protein
MSDPGIIPPADATDAEIETFIASVHREARRRVREMIAAGAPHDEVMEYVASVEAAERDQEGSQE